MHAPPHHADPDPWTERAACRDTDPETFFPLPGASGGLDREAIAKRLCGRCPVARECLREALLRDEGAGIWGGFNARDRRELLRVAGTLESTGAQLAAYLAGGGRRLSATPRERPAYVWYLRRHGWTPRRIAGALGISFGQVQQAWQLAELASSCTRGPVSGMPTPRAPRKRVRRAAGEQGVVGVERPEIRSGVTALGRTPLSGYGTRGRATPPERLPIPPAGGHPAGPVPTDRTRSALAGEGRGAAGAPGGMRGSVPVDGRRASAGGARGVTPADGRPVATGGARGAASADGRPVATGGARGAASADGRPVATGGARGAASADGRPVPTSGMRGAVPAEARRRAGGSVPSEARGGAGGSRAPQRPQVPPAARYPAPQLPADGRRAPGANAGDRTRAQVAADGRRLPGGTPTNPPRGPLTPDGRRATNPVPTNPPRGPLTSDRQRATNAVPTNPPRGPLAPNGRRAPGAIPAQPARGPVAGDGRRTPGPAAGDPSYAPLPPDGRRARGPIPAQPGRGPLAPDGQRTPGTVPRNPAYAPPARDGQRTPGAVPRNPTHTPLTPDGQRTPRPVPLNPSPEPLGWEGRREPGMVPADRMRVLLALKARRLPERPRVTLTSESARTFVAPGSPRVTITIRPVPGNPRGGTS